MPKIILENESVFILFASLFVNHGYAESLIISQFLENIHELRKIQRYILQFINYFPKHLIDFLVSSSLIEEILAKNQQMSKIEEVDKILRDVIQSPELYQANSEERKKIQYNYIRVNFINYMFSIKVNR